jgi:hypothetical protein
VVKVKPLPLYTRKTDPLHTVQENWVRVGADLNGCKKNLTFTELRIPDFPARNIYVYILRYVHLPE